MTRAPEPAGRSPRETSPVGHRAAGHGAEEVPADRDLRRMDLVLRLEAARRGRRCAARRIPE